MPLLLYSNGNYERKEGFGYEFQSEKNNYEETITRTPADKISILKDMQTNIKNIYTMIFDELDVLFYGII